MKSIKYLLPATLLMLAASQGAWAKIKVVNPQNPTATVTFEERPVATDSIVATGSVTLKKGSGSYQMKGGIPARVTILVGDEAIGNLFAVPEDEITVDVQPEGLPIYKGTPLVEGATEVSMKAQAIEKQAEGLQQLFQTDPQAAQDLYEKLSGEYEAIFSDFIDANPNSTAVANALLGLDGQKFMDYYTAMTPQARESIMMPLVESKKAKVQAQLEKEAAIEAMQKGDVTAPLFTLPNVSGEKVSLSDFRGKWVVLDFWGAWCRWCIKGFPELKEAYKNYEGKLEVIGIDNRDTPEKWRAAVEKYALPWVNVYNDTETPEGAALLNSYLIQGFPTKVIIDPEGIIRNITVGEDPAFYTALENLVK